MAKIIIEKHFSGTIKVVNTFSGVIFVLKVPKC